MKRLTLNQDSKIKACKSKINYILSAKEENR